MARNEGFLFFFSSLFLENKTKEDKIDAPHPHIKWCYYSSISFKSKALNLYPHLDCTMPPYQSHIYIYICISRWGRGFWEISCMVSSEGKREEWVKIDESFGENGFVLELLEDFEHEHIWEKIKWSDGKKEKGNKGVGRRVLVLKSTRIKEGITFPLFSFILFFNFYLLCWGLTQREVWLKANRPQCHTRHLFYWELN